MPETPNNLPTTQPFAWQGFSLTIPADWNLTHHHGNARRGIATLSALRGPRMEIRWQSGNPRSLKQTYDKICQRVATRQRDAQLTRAPEGLSSEVTEITIPSQRLYLAVTPCRLFECMLPPHVDRPQALAVMRSMKEFFGNSLWRWQVYGIDGAVPRNFKLRRASLLPGGSHLDFRRYWHNITLGSFSRAEALLAGKPLSDFARQHIALIKHHPEPPVQTTPTLVRYEIPIRRLGIKTYHGLLLEHHPTNNIITWRHEW